MMVDPDGELAWFVPLIIGVVVGGTSQGLASANAGGSFWDGNNIGQGALVGGAFGGVFAAATSPQLSDAVRGQKFRSNSKVLAGFVERGDHQGALNHFGFEGTYDPSRTEGHPGGTTRSGDIYYSETAFSSYDRLASIVDHEMFHRSNMLSGKYNNINGSIPFDLVGLEEHGAYMLNYKNQGFYPKHGFSFLDGIESSGAQGGLYDQYNLFESKWRHFIYKIPRRY